MALIKCPECGKEISDKSKSCIHCGYPLDNLEKESDDCIREDGINSVENDTDIVEKESDEVSANLDMEQNSNEEFTYNSNSKYMAFLLIGVIVLVIVIIAVQAINDNQKQNAIAQQSISYYSGGEYVQALDEKRELNKDSKLGEYEQKIVLMGNLQQRHDAEEGSYNCVLYYLANYDDFKDLQLSDIAYPIVKEAAQKVANYNLNLAEQFERTLDDEENSQDLEPMLSNNKDEMIEVMSKIDGDVDYALAKREYSNYLSDMKEQRENEYDASHPVQVSNDDCKITHKNGYYYCNGTVHNVSGSTYTYIKVKVTYYDKDNNVLTTDWTYAVSSEGIKGGENQQFEIMTKVDGSVDKYKVEIIE